MNEQRTDFGSRILDFVQDYVADHGYAPTYDEIQAALGLCSRSHAAYYLGALERKGLIERTPRIPRGLRLLKAPGQACERHQGQGAPGVRKCAVPGGRRL